MTPPTPRPYRGARTARTPRATILAAIALVLPAIAPNASAQESMVTPAVTFPAKGRITFRTQFHYMRLNGNGEDISQQQIWNRLTYGIDRDTTLSFDLPLITRSLLAEDSNTDSFSGIGDARLTLKRRLWQEDSGGYSSSRIGLLLGLELPVGTKEFSSDSFDPFVGLAFMTIQERHGFNVAATYKFSTTSDDFNVMPGQAGDDLLKLETAYLYRLSPETYTAETEGAWYAMLESDLLYETNSDTEFYLTPGILYEARRWAFEAGVHAPIAERVNNRPELDYGFVIGFRYLF